MNMIKKIVRNIMNTLWHLFLNGLLAIAPLTITIAVFSFSIGKIHEWFLRPLRCSLEGTCPNLIYKIPYFEVIIIFGIILIIGSLLKLFITRSLVHTFENLLIKIPLVRPVYSGTKQLMQAFSTQDKITFQKVVVVPYPRMGVYSIGFLTSQLPNQITPQKGTTYFNVFIPTTPNPTSGFFAIVPEAEITVVDLTRQEAMAMIISGGIIQPERLMSPKTKQKTDHTAHQDQTDSTHS